VFVSNPGRSTGYADWSFSWFSSVLPGKYCYSTSSRPWPRPSKSFRIHHSSMILQLDAMYCRHWMRSQITHKYWKEIAGLCIGVTWYSGIQLQHLQRHVIQAIAMLFLLYWSYNPVCASRPLPRFRNRFFHGGVIRHTANHHMEDQALQFVWPLPGHGWLYQELTLPPAQLSGSLGRADFSPP
jgi:hypothetical protein